MYKDGEKVEFMPPEGFVIPEGSDGEFSIVCDFRMEGNKLCMTKLGDHKMPGYDEGSDSKPDYSEYAKGMQSQMNGGQS